MEINEAVRLANKLFRSKKGGCIYCGSVGCDGPKRGKKKRPKVVSEPSKLGCDKQKRLKPVPYGTAAHHIIPAIQCYARIEAIVWMGAEAGYDINDTTNGMSLPSYYYDEAGKVDCGELGNDRARLAARVMKATRQVTVHAQRASVTPSAG